MLDIGGRERLYGGEKAQEDECRSRRELHGEGGTLLRVELSLMVVIIQRLTSSKEWFDLSFSER